MALIHQRSMGRPLGRLAENYSRMLDIDMERRIIRITLTVVAHRNTPSLSLEGQVRLAVPPRAIHAPASDVIQSTTSFLSICRAPGTTSCPLIVFRACRPSNIQGHETPVAPRPGIKLGSVACSPGGQCNKRALQPAHFPPTPLTWK